MAYETILVPTDGSDCAAEAVEHALDLAEKYDATVHALFVVDTTYPYADFEAPAINFEAIVQSMEKEGARVTDAVVTEADERGVAAEATVKRATSIHNAILDYADDTDVDLIVMGTHGRRGLDRYLIGSVAEKVVRLADQPVLTVKSHEE